jgi:hypothetical protein
MTMRNRMLLLAVLAAASPRGVSADDAGLEAWSMPALRALAEELPAFPEALLSKGEDPKRILLAIAADGSTTLVTGPGKPATSFASTVGADKDGMEREAAAYEGLREALVQEARPPALREADGRSKIRVLLAVSRHARWDRVLHALSVCAHPTVRIGRFSLVVRREGAEAGALGRVDLADEPFAPSMPMGVLPGGTEDKTESEREKDLVRLRLIRKEKHEPAATYTRVRIGEEFVADGPKPSVTDAKDVESAWKTVLDRVKAEVAAVAERRASESRSRPTVVFSVPPPDGTAIPYGDVARLLRALRTDGFDVRFENIGFPLARR